MPYPTPISWPNARQENLEASARHTYLAPGETSNRGTNRSSQYRDSYSRSVQK